MIRSMMVLLVVGAFHTGLASNTRVSPAFHLWVQLVFGANPQREVFIFLVATFSLLLRKISENREESNASRVATRIIWTLQGYIIVDKSAQALLGYFTLGPASASVGRRVAPRSATQRSVPSVWCFRVLANSSLDCSN